MTLPIGTLSFSDITTEVAAGAIANTAYSSNMDWVRTNSKPAMTDFNTLRGKAFYKSTAGGNCANGNCPTVCNCGNINCGNCLIAGNVNCLNCDAKPLIQANCNCGTPFNCTTTGTSYACNCDCDCDCNCNCPVDCDCPVVCNCPVDCPVDCDCACDCACNCDCGG